MIKMAGHENAFDIRAQDLRERDRHTYRRTETYSCSGPDQQVEVRNYPLQTQLIE